MPFDFRMEHETEAIVIETRCSQPFKLINGASEGSEIGMCARIIRHRYRYAL